MLYTSWTSAAQVLERQYSEKQQEYFYPTAVGKVLLGGYQRMGFDLGRPELRAEMERDMDKVVSGAITKQQCIDNSGARAPLDLLLCGVDSSS